MNKLFIYDSGTVDKISAFRGGGRILQLLKENLPDAEFVSDFNPTSSRLKTELRGAGRLQLISTDFNLLIPSWNPFSSPISQFPISSFKFLIIFDTIPLKYSSHFPVGIKGKINLWSNKQALKNFDKIITISEVSKQDIIKYLNIPEEKIEVIYPCLAKIFLSSKKQKTSSKQISNNKSQSNNALNTEYSILHTPYCLYVGDVNWNKNLVNLAKAIKIANVNCVFVGKAFTNKAWSMEHKTLMENAQGSMLNAQFNHPWLTEFKQFLQEVNDDPRFIFPGYVSDDELIQLYQHATCNLLVSHDEGFGFSFIEAGSQGCPSVLADIPIFHETADRAGQTPSVGSDSVQRSPLGGALFADPNNPEEIASQISKLFNDTKLRGSLGKQTQKYVIDKYSPEKFRKKIIKLID